MTSPVDFYSLTIGSPVMAAHLNAIQDRIAMIARYAPAVMSADTIGTIGYQYSGGKVTSQYPAQGLGLVRCDLIAPSCNVNVSTATVVGGGRYYSMAAPLRSRDSLRTRYRTANVKSPDTTTATDVCANLVPSCGLTAGPNVAQIPYVVDQLPSSNTVPIGVWIADFLVGTWSWEVDHLPYNAWISQPTIEVSNAPSD